MKRVIAAAGLALAVASTAACGGAHTSSPTTVTVTAALPAAQTVTSPPAPPPEVLTVESLYISANGWECLDNGVCPRGSGYYVIAHLLVTDISKMPQRFFPSRQRLVDGQGRQYFPELRELCGLNGNPVINPGNDLMCDLPFEVPNRTTPGDYTLVSDGRSS